MTDPISFIDTDSVDDFPFLETILQREIPQEDLLKMLAEGKTGLIKGFISNRTKRPFDAFLTFDPEKGKVGFEFPPRPAKKAAKKASKS